MTQDKVRQAYSSTFYKSTYFWVIYIIMFLLSGAPIILSTQISPFILGELLGAIIAGLAIPFIISLAIYNVPRLFLKLRGK